MKFEGVIFDFNGVLWWDTELQEEAWKEISLQIRGEMFSSEEIDINVHGRNNQHTFEYLIGENVTGSKLDELTQKKENIYRNLCLKEKENFQLSPGAIKLLDYLTTTDKLFTIATASEITNLNFFIQNLSLENWFEIEKIVFDDGIRPCKPSPDIYLEAAKRLKLPPEKCIVVEDSYSGIESAVSANIGCVIGLGPKSKHDTLLKNSEVKYVIERLDELINLNLI